MTPAEVSLESLCLRGLLRYLGAGPRSPYGGPVTSLSEEDSDALRMWWALSEPVGDLANRCATQPREISPVLDDFRKEVSGELPGPPNAAASALLQALTCDPGAFVVTEASDTWHSGPNRVLVKTLDAARGALRAAALHARGGIFDGPAAERLFLIEDALLVAPLREILASPAGRAPIVAHERRQAAKARSPLYRLSWDCASSLAGIDDLEPDSLSALLAGELLPRMEVWRRFEMACLLEMGEALSGIVGEPCVFDASFAAGRPAARIGDLDIWWQRAIPARAPAMLDEGERKVANLAASLGAIAGTARADLTVERRGRILGIAECKWFADESSVPGATLEACSQLVGYARDAAHRQGESYDEILARSLVALAHRGEAPLRAGAPVGCVGLFDLGDAALAEWALLIAEA